MFGKNLCFNFILIIALANSISSCAPYAFKDAYAYYKIDYELSYTSFKADVKYKILEVWCSNSTMIVDIDVDGTLPIIVSGRYRDYIGEPEYFPAIPPSARGKETIEYKDIKFKLVKVDRLNVDAGTFDVYVYRSIEDDGIVEIYVDVNTGLIIKAYFERGIVPLKTVVRYELYDTNIRSINFIILLLVVFATVGAFMAIVLLLVTKRRRRITKCTQSNPSNTELSRNGSETDKLMSLLGS